MALISSRSPRRIAAAMLVVASVATAPFLHAQNILRGGRRGMAPRMVQASDFDGSFMYCRAFYRSILNTGSGSGWDTDYPAADNCRMRKLPRHSSVVGPPFDPPQPLLRHLPRYRLQHHGL